MQFIIVSKSELDSRLLMSLIAQESSSNCIFFSSPYAMVIVSDGHDKPFCIEAITKIDNFKKAFGDTDKSQFF